MIVNPISYPGNKNKLLSQIIPELPNNCSQIVEIFCGSGVVSINSNINNILLNDISIHAIDLLKYFYTTSFEDIISKIEDIILEYKLTYTYKEGKANYIELKHEGLSNYNREGYQKLKNDYNKQNDINKLIVLLIYGFNHYIRFNNDNQFNVPVGKVDLSSSIYKNLKLFVNHIKSKTISFSNKDFREPSLYQDKKAVYYFDPPYLITNAPYNSNWNIDDEKDLLNLLDDLNDKGIKFVLSNVILSNGKENSLLKEWSKKYTTLILKRQYRNANYQKKNITDTIEVLIKNY